MRSPTCAEARKHVGLYDSGLDSVCSIYFLNIDISLGKYHEMEYNSRMKRVERLDK